MSNSNRLCLYVLDKSDPTALPELGIENQVVQVSLGISPAQELDPDGRALNKAFFGAGSPQFRTTLPFAIAEAERAVIAQPVTIDVHLDANPDNLAENETGTTASRICLNLLGKSQRTISEATGDEVVNLQLGCNADTQISEAAGQLNKLTIGGERPAISQMIPVSPAIAEQIDIGAPVTLCFWWGLTPSQVPQLAQAGTAAAAHA